MLMESPAGDLEIEFVKVVKKGDKLIIMAKTGVWDSQIYVSRSDFFSATKKFLSKDAFAFALESLYKGLADRLSGATNEAVPKAEDTGTTQA